MKQPPSPRSFAVVAAAEHETQADELTRRATAGQPIRARRVTDDRRPSKPPRRERRDIERIPMCCLVCDRPLLEHIITERCYQR